MTDETVATLEQLPMIHRPVVMFVINNVYASASSARDVYDATRGHWRIGATSRELAEVALGVVDGVVRSAFEIDGWRRTADDAKLPSKIDDDSRWYFEGRETEQTRSWIGKSVRHLAPPKGAANPVRLFLEGVPAAATAAALHSSITVLDTEPLARIMLGNNELFHSNFLAWIFEQFPAQSDAVFGSRVPQNGSGSGERKVERERENLDLVMHWADRPSLVIENKVFSVPRTKQLDSYAEKLAKWKNPVGAAIVVSPTMPLVLGEGYRTEFSYRGGAPIVWKHLNFEVLADALESAFVTEPADYEVETVRRYCRILKALAGVVATAKVVSQDGRVFGEEPEALSNQPKQLLTGLAKARAEQVAEAVENGLLASGLEDHSVESGLDRSLPRLSWYKELEISGETVTAGWQYQEGNIRLVLVLKHLAGRGTEAKIRRRDFGLMHPEFFSFDHLDKILGTEEVALSASSRAEGPFGHFDPDFLYRQKRAENLTVNQLLELTIAQTKHLARFAVTG